MIIYVTYDPFQYNHSATFYLDELVFEYIDNT